VKKKDKYFSVFIIPHHRGPQRTITISRRAFKTMRLALPAILLILTAFLVDYFMMNGTRRSYRKLQQDYARQESILSDYRAAIGDLEASIQEFDAYRTKLNIMAGLRAEESLEGEPGVGGPDGGQLTVEPGFDPGLSRLQDIDTRAEGIENNLVSLAEYFQDQNEMLAQTPSIIPTKGFMSSGFKYRNDPFTGEWTFHPGLDIATQHGNPVLATADGIVISTKTETRGGKTVKISHPRTGWITVYCHLSKFMVKSGQRIKRGETIGLVGRTGRARAPHVHYEVRREGKRYNPWNFILDH
jgi:murein DD-endopeptidase MepM/ murein hydrolase activator NlpD